MNAQLGKLEKLSPRQAWKNEAAEFTPWLAQEENLGLLADALGLSDLSLVQTEYPIGSFSLDILCTDEQGKVIIENQLDPTDHKHLGQILTYAAGVEAKKVIWIADSFRAEHIAALEFLNHNTTSDLNFFAVEISLWKIDDSPLSPNFNVVVKPNDWSKTTLETARVASVSTPTKQLQLKFWTGWVDYLKTRQSTLRTGKPDGRHYLDVRLGKSSIRLAAAMYLRKGSLIAELYILDDNAKQMYSSLLVMKTEIESKLGFSLDWLEHPDKPRLCEVLLQKDGIDLKDESNWTSCYIWLADALEKMDQVFRPIVKEL